LKALLKADDSGISTRTDLLHLKFGRARTLRVGLLRGVSGSDMLLSTLAGYIEALGGRLELHATFPGHPEEEIAVTVEGPSASRDQENVQGASPVKRCTRDDPSS
jgi:hypothetical protein